jgi:hypothetical protein
MNKRSIATVLTFMIMALLACVSSTPPAPGTFSYAYATFTPSPQSGDDQEATYAAAQATLDSGQSEVMALSHQATVVSLNMDQAAAVAAQATVDYNQRQLMELSIRATEVSLAMARAAATQQFIVEQTQTAQNATATAQSQAAAATAQSQAATATVSAYILNVTQTAQAQAILAGHAAETAQAQATQTAYPLTATPEAATQAYMVRTREGRERRALWEEFVVTPVRAVLTALVVVLLIVGGVLAFRRLMPVLEYRLRNPRGPGNVSPLSLTGGTIVDLEPYDRRLEQREPALLGLPQLVSDDTPQVEIIDPSEPSIINWVAEAERKLRTQGRTQL